MRSPSAPTGPFRSRPRACRVREGLDEARYALLTRILRAAPVAWRFFVKHQLFKALEGRAAGPDGGTAEMLEAYAALATRFADLPAPSIVVNETRAPEETRVTA